MIKTAIALLIAAILFIGFGGCGGGGGDEDEDFAPAEVLSVGPEGGVLAFDNGVVLDIPPGAVQEKVDIRVTELDCAANEQYFNTAAFQSRFKGCIGGIDAEPDGLTFALPITIRAPVRPLEPGEIPVQVLLDRDRNDLSIAPTALSYNSMAGVVVISNVHHFSENWVATLYDWVEDNCRNCETAEAIPEFCQAYSHDVWRNQQPSCCLLSRSEREKCQPNCFCCMEMLMSVESLGIDAILGECQLSTTDLKVSYPFCPDPTPWIYTETETTPECGKDMTLELDIVPQILTIAVCEKKDLNKELKVNLTGRGPDGEIVFGPTQVLPKWKLADDSLGEIDADDMLFALKRGQTTLKAVLSSDPSMPSASVTLDVQERSGACIAGNWQLTPTSQGEQCRYTGQEWWEEDEFSAFNVSIIQPSDEDSSYIEASYIPSAGGALTGHWDIDTGAFDLSINSSETRDCGYLFYGSDICGDAIDCRLVSCQIVTQITGTGLPPVDTLTAVSNWYYRVVFSYYRGPDMPPGETTWECQGEATFAGVRP